MRAIGVNATEVQTTTIFQAQDITIQVGFGMQVAKTPTYLVMCQFPRFVVVM